MLSGIARCGLCGDKLYATYPHGRDKAMVYACRPTAHVACSGAALDNFVVVAVLEWLSRPDSQRQLGVGQTNATDKDQLWERWDQLSPAMRAEIIDEVCVVTVYPAGRDGCRDFDPRLVDIMFKSGLELD
jgi:hypothetical protein